MEATFTSAPPDLSLVPGVSDVEVDGDRVRLQVRGSVEPLLERLAAARVTQLLSREPSLEELFLASTVPRRRPQAGRWPSMSAETIGIRRPVRAARHPGLIAAGRAARGATRGALIWGGVFGLMVWELVSQFGNEYPTAAARAMLTKTMGSSVGLQAIFGMAHHIDTAAGDTAYHAIGVLGLPGRPGRKSRWSPPKATTPRGYTLAA